MNTRNAFAALVAISISVGACTADTLQEEQATSEDALTGAYKVGTALETTADVNLRGGPSTTASVFDVIPRGTRVVSAAAQPSGGFYGVTWSGKTGWVSGTYLKVPTAGGSAPAGGHYSRQNVYDAAKGRKTCSGGSASDLLNPGLTTQQLVDAVGWVAANTSFSWGWCVINTGHHLDPAAHSGGFAIDIFANNSGDDAAMLRLINQNPYFVEVGVSGDYVSLRGLISSATKCSFVENAPTHIHASVRRAFC